MSVESTGRGRVRFGVFELDLSAGELHRNGSKVKLQEQPFQVLAALLERPGEVVMREEICERLWPDGTFIEFDRSLNIAVNKLRDALGDSAENPRFVETVPRRGHRFIAPVDGAGVSGKGRIPLPRWLLWAAGVALVSIVAALTARIDPRQGVATMNVAIPLTSYEGSEVDPAFSPNGGDIVFSWKSDSASSFDIYRRQIGSGDPLQLTNHPGDELSPVWSPDGTEIAFLRLSTEWQHTTITGARRASIVTMPALGGAGREFAEVDFPANFDGLSHRRLAWSPDGRWLVAPDHLEPEDPYALFSIWIETGERRRLTNPPSTVEGDVAPAFSRDGRSIAFVRTSLDRQSHLYMMDFSGDSTQLSELRRLAPGFDNARDPAWTANGDEIVFSAWRRGSRELWRVAASGTREPELLPTGHDAYLPSLSWRGNRLAFVRSHTGGDIWRYQVPADGSAPEPPSRFLSSTRNDTWPRFSPDGTRIAFKSERSGVSEIWIANSDGTGVRQLTLTERGMSSSPRWSPDGETIVFDSSREGQYDIFTIPVRGGTPLRITQHPAGDVAPSWSWDGNWIYFSSDRGGERNVWKAPRRGGDAIPVTRHRGGNSLESTDGKWLYYNRERGLWRVPVAGGEEVRVLEWIWGRAFQVTSDGIYYRPGSERGENPTIRFYRYADGEDSLVLPLPDESIGSGLTVSPDGRTILITQAAPAVADLMLVEDFR